MDKLLFVGCLATLVCLVQCKTLISANAVTKDGDTGTDVRPEVNEVTRQQLRQWDGSVFKEAKKPVEADTQFIKTSRARGVATEKPSDVANTVEGTITEMRDIVQDTVTGSFRDGKDDEPEESEEKNTVEQDESAEDANSEEKQSVQTAENDENDEDDEDDDDDDGAIDKEEKKKRLALIQFLISGFVIKEKLTQGDILEIPLLLLKFLVTLPQILYTLISSGIGTIFVPLIVTKLFRFW